MTRAWEGRPSVRVLHVLDHSVPLQSGYSFRTLAILREQRRMGWDTAHVTSPKQGTFAAPEETVDDLVFHRTRGPVGLLANVRGLGEVALMAETAHRIEQVARSFRPDVLHAHSPVLNALPALRIGRKLGIPVVYEVRAFWEDAAVDHGTTRPNRPRYLMTRSLESYALRRVDAVITICEGLRRDIVARGIPEAKVTVVPNAVDPDRFAPAGTPDAALRDRLGLTGGAVLGFVGSFYAYEGLDLLIDALPRILDRVPQTRLLLVGGGPQEDVLRARAADRGVADYVVFTGRVPHGDVGAYYDLIDLLVYPRHPMWLTELVTPLKPLEAMAMGKALVASDVGGHRELVTNGVTGVLFRAGDSRDLAQACTGLLENPESCAALRAAGRRFVLRERTWATSVRRYRPVYEGCLRGPSDGAGERTHDFVPRLAH